MISKAHLSRVRFINKVKMERQNLFLHEVYGLAITFGIKPSQLFNYFYGDGERPIICLAPEKQEEEENKDT